MTKDEKMTSEGLRQLGLSDMQVEQTLDITRRIPEKLDAKRIQRVIDKISQANQALTKLNEFDSYFVSNANELLSPELSLSYEPMKTIANTLQMHLDNQAAQVIQEVALTPDSKGSGLVRRATTPTSKNFKRYEMLTNLWDSWGNEVNLYEASDFMMFLATALEGRFTLQKGSNCVFRRFRTPAPV